MKQIKTIIAIAIFAILSFNQVMAGQKEDSITNLPVELKFMGTVESQHLFELSFAGSTKENEYSVSITDESGYVFFNDIFKGESFTKRFSLNTEVLEESDVTFSITEKKSGKKVNYHVTRQSRVSEEMNIVKL